MTRLDHNRAARPSSRRSSACRSPRCTNMTIWGNHSATQYPDLFHAEVGGEARRRSGRPGAGCETSSSRPSPSAAPRSSRRAAPPRRRRRRTPAIDHVHAWVNGTPDGDWTSAAIVSDGSYGVPEGLISVVPGHLGRRPWRDRPGPGDRRVLPRPDRRLGGRAGRGARRRHRPRPDLARPDVRTTGRRTTGDRPSTRSTRGEDQGRQPRRRARRRRDDADHLAVDQGQADPPVPRRRPEVLRPRRSRTATPPTTR